jgi:predicted MPP superfamily phosphohydrolase
MFRPIASIRFRIVGLAPLLALAVVLSAFIQTAPPPDIAMPNKDGSLKFGVLGDFGTGEPLQYQMAEQISKTWQAFKFPLMILVGDNLYGSERPQDFRVKFEEPYKLLLENHVVFQASLGNHDAREQRSYKPFNMNDQLYYSFKAPSQSVRFFALESTYPVPEQIVWFEKELKNSTEDWKIAYFHHPLYSSAGRHGSDTQLRAKLEPLLVQYNVSVVFTGHDHVYERTKPQKDVTYFVCGSGGQLAVGDLDPKSNITAKGFDKENAFLIAEINGDNLTFNTISRSGNIVDSGVIKRRGAK